MAENLTRTLAEYSRRVAERMTALVPCTPGNLLSEAAWHHLETGGKRLRPALCLATCEALGGDPNAALDFALAVELMHNMFLVHDDLEDEDRVRRDREAVWAKYGAANAINVGDYLLGLAFRSLLNTPADDATRLALADAFVLAYEKTVCGQDLDLNSRADPRLTLERYEEMVLLKTGYYLALGMVGGAIIAGAEPAVVEKLWEFGRCAGPAFQVHDDIIDLTQGKGRGGKLGCDIEEGKASILYAHALQHAAPADRERLIGVMAAPRDATREADVRWVIGLYERLGSVQFARDYAADLLAKAQKVIDSLPTEKRRTLGELTAYLTERAT